MYYLLLNSYPVLTMLLGLCVCNRIPKPFNVKITTFAQCILNLITCKYFFQLVSWSFGQSLWKLLHCTNIMIQINGCVYYICKITTIFFMKINNYILIKKFLPNSTDIKFDLENQISIKNNCKK